MRLEGARLGNACLNGAVLVEARLRASEFQQAQLRECDLTDAWMQGARLIETRLEGATVLSGRLVAAYCRGVSFRGADLTDSRLQAAILSGAQMQAARMDGASLQGAVLSGADLRGTGSLGTSSASSFGERVWERVDEEDVVSREGCSARFGGAIEDGGAQELAAELPSEHARQVFWTQIGPHLDLSACHRVPQEAGAILGAYSREEAEAWIAEHDFEMSLNG